MNHNGAGIDVVIDRISADGDRTLARLLLGLEIFQFRLGFGAVRLVLLLRARGKDG
jgi:hypothetical protein